MHRRALGGFGLTGGALVVALLASPARAEQRCGWIDNPTPANWSLVDREGEWIIGSQGGRQADGMDLIPDLSGREWVETNGSYGYGYGCACMSVSTHRADRSIVAIRSVRQLPLAKCRKDPGLPRR